MPTPPRGTLFGSNQPFLTQGAGLAALRRHGLGYLGFLRSWRRSRINVCSTGERASHAFFRSAAVHAESTKPLRIRSTVSSFFGNCPNSGSFFDATTLLTGTEGLRTATLLTDTDLSATGGSGRRFAGDQLSRTSGSARYSSRSFARVFGVVILSDPVARPCSPSGNWFH